MNTKKIIVSLILMFVITSISGQDTFDLIEEIISNNQSLKAARIEADQMKVQAKVGNSPADPEITYGYLWGNDVINANRKDFSITQRFSFPGVYIQKNKLSKQHAELAELYYEDVEHEIILESLNIIIELVYKNKKLKLLEDRLKNSETIEAMTSKMFTEGEVGRIESDKASLQRINLLSEYDVCRTDINVLLSELRTLNGGKTIDYTSISYPEYLSRTNLESLKIKYLQNDMELRLLKQDEVIKTQEIRLNQQAYLPEFSLSYVGETIRNEKLKGIRGGLTIPLWQKRNTVKVARISLDLNKSKQEYAIHKREAKWDQQFDLYKIRSERLNSLKVLLDRITPGKSLMKAFELGEISLRTYITESVFYYQSEDNYLQLEMEMNSALAKLFIVELCSQLN